MSKDLPLNQVSITRDQVRDRYGAIAESEAAAGEDAQGCCGPSPSASACCGGLLGIDAAKLAGQIGYSVEELQNLPQGSNMGLSCGNPTAIAALKPGEVVLDLGSGGGFDAFLAGPKVGAAGRVIGVDMTPQMLSKARTNIDHYRKQTGLDNVEFRLGEIEHLPVADASVDVLISNCVINLSTDKPQVWREIARVLKPGSRVAASDLALYKPLPSAVVSMVEAWIGCVAGAVLLDEYRAMVDAAGLVDVQLKPDPTYVEALVAVNDPLYQQIASHLPAGGKASEYVTSVAVEARKAQ